MPKVEKVCERCGKHFFVRANELKEGRGHFCNSKCRGMELNIRPVNERFWEKVDKSAGQDGCWLWTAALNNKGYGFFYPHHGEREYAHRFSYALAYGPIPEGMKVLHRCDNPPCCNPAHLFLGTMADNTQDMMKKGRHRKMPMGKDNWRHHRPGKTKLQESDIPIIRSAYEQGIRIVDLARQFHVSETTISHVIKRKSWTYL